VALLRRQLDQDPSGKDRPLVMGVDGSYTNKTVLKGLPSRTTLIGRIRKDAKLFYPPGPADQAPKGRRRQYGSQAPTPLELQRDDSTPWQEVGAYASGKVHAFRVKTIGPVLWPKAGPNRHLRVVVIAPVGYRLRAGGKLLYRQPAYLICTDPDMSLEQIVQYYLWRWDIEVNHRDEKQFIGVGQAQVRSIRSADRDPTFAVASYAMLLLAAAQTYGHQTSTGLPVPKWRTGRPKNRLTIQDLIAQVRQELWSHAINDLEKLTTNVQRHSGHFASDSHPVTKCPEFQPTLALAAFLAATG
jgi:hypothetical protein